MPTMMSSTAFERAAAYLRTDARPLERALYDFHFAKGSRTQVHAALVQYQNEDGGFGRGLEPDMPANASSVLATTFALAILREIGASEETSGLPAALAYLVDTYDVEKDRWPIVSPAVEDAPHAPWWEYATSEENFRGFWANPRAGVIGYLWQYHRLVPSPFVEEALRATAADLMTYAQHMEMHDLMCFIDLLETPNIPQEMHEDILDKLRRAVPRSVETNPAEWHGYNLKPISVIRSPESPLAGTIEPSVIDANLDYLIAQQGEDGAWPPNWSWEFVDETAWAKAEKEWKGVLTLRNLRTLKSFGRLL